MRPALLPNCLLLAAVTLLAGCGGASSRVDESATSVAGPGALVHADGLVAMTDAGFELDPGTNEDTIAFEIGSALKRGVLRALAASGTPTRVTYRLTEALPIAVVVVPAPRIEGLSSFVGAVSSVSADTLTIDGEDGKRSFTIATVDAPAFDIAHLRAHSKDGTPVRVYSDPKKPNAGIAYEDA